MVYFVIKASLHTSSRLIIGDTHVHYRLPQFFSNKSWLKNLLLLPFNVLFYAIESAWVHGTEEVYVSSEKYNSWLISLSFWKQLKCKGVLDFTVVMWFPAGFFVSSMLCCNSECSSRKQDRFYLLMSRNRKTETAHEQRKGCILFKFPNTKCTVCCV